MIDRVEWELLSYPLPSAIGGSGVRLVDLIACSVHTIDGNMGFGFSYAIGGGGAASLLAARTITEEIVTGRAVMHPEAMWLRLRATCNRTGKGPNFVGLAALDLAIWDHYARGLGVPLGIAMGGTPRTVPVYGSGGYRPNQTPEAVAEQVTQHRARGFRAIKLRLSGSAQDEARLAAAREACGTELILMTDLNEKGCLTTARRTIARVLDHGGAFVEEPLPACDLAGYRILARAFPGAIATGEHLQGIDEALPFITDGLCAAIQPDLAMGGGMTEALKIARMAEAHGVEVMPHFLPCLFIHLAAAAPNVTWLEDFPLLEPLLDGIPEIDANGQLSLGVAHGHGLTLNPEARRICLRQ
jgi:L-alanine-DL-glutamate epimerase-like enolase superfamily enzyme